MCNLNTAPIEELAELPGIGAALAYELMLWRPYLDWAEVEHVPGLDWEKVGALRAAGAEIARRP